MVNGTERSFVNYNFIALHTACIAYFKSVIPKVTKNIRLLFRCLVSSFNPTISSERPIQNEIIFTYQNPVAVIKMYTTFLSDIFKLSYLLGH